MTDSTEGPTAHYPLSSFCGPVLISYNLLLLQEDYWYNTELVSNRIKAETRKQNENNPHSHFGHDRNPMVALFLCS